MIVKDDVLTSLSLSIARALTIDGKFEHKLSDTNRHKQTNRHILFLKTLLSYRAFTKNTLARLTNSNSIMYSNITHRINQTSSPSYDIHPSNTNNRKIINTNRSNRTLKETFKKTQLRCSATTTTATTINNNNIIIILEIPKTILVSHDEDDNNSNTKKKEIENSEIIRNKLVKLANEIPELTWTANQVIEELGKDISRVFVCCSRRSSTYSFDDDDDDEEEEDETIQEKEEVEEFVGFLVCWVVGKEETQILELAVRPDMRRKGIACKLIERAMEIDSEETYLEVSERNANAIRLYEKYGFKVANGATARKNYYKDGSSALLMSAKKPYLFQSQSETSAETKEEIVTTRELVRRLAGLSEELAKIPAPLDPNDRSDVDGQSRYIRTKDPVREVPFERNRRGENDFSYRRSNRRKSLLDDD